MVALAQSWPLLLVTSMRKNVRRSIGDSCERYKREAPWC